MRSSFPLAGLGAGAWFLDARRSPPPLRATRRHPGSLRSSTSTSTPLTRMITRPIHQSAAESANDSQCTAWTVSLCLVPNENGYLIDNPPSGYHAQDAACG